MTQELAAVREEAATAGYGATAARDDAMRAKEQLVKALAEQSKAITEAEIRAATVAQEAAATTVASAAEMAEKAAVANRQQLEALKADLATQQAKLEATEQEAREVGTLRQQVRDVQQQLAAALAELAAVKELRRDASERLAESQTELEDALFGSQSLEAERQMLVEQVEQLTADRSRLETQVQELEASLLDAVTAVNMPSASHDVDVLDGEGNGEEFVEASGLGQDAPAARSVSRSAGGASANGDEGVVQLEALGVKALAVQLVAARAEVNDLRKELERTIVDHAEEEEAVQTENVKLKGQVEELTTGLEAAEGRISELEIAQALKDQLSAQLGNTQYALEEARSSIEAMRQEMQELQQERAAVQSREGDARLELEKVQQQLKEAQMRSVELVTAQADRQVELSKLRSEVASQGMMSDSNTQMTTKLLTDYQALKDEHARLRNELHSKDEMMALLQEQLSSLTEIDLDAMLKQIDTVQSRKMGKKTAAAPMEAMLAAAGLSARSNPSLSSGGGAPMSQATNVLASSNGGAAEMPTDS